MSLKVILFMFCTGLSIYYMLTESERKGYIKFCGFTAALSAFYLGVNL